MRKLIFFLLLIAFGCSTDRREKCVFIPDTKDITIDLEWESLEDSLPSFTTKKQLTDFLTRHADIRDLVLGRHQYPNDSTFINDRFRKFTNPHIDSLLTETHNVFGDAAQLKEEFRKAFANIKYYYPGFKPPKIKTIVTGFEHDIFLSDTLLVIGLDYFKGQNGKYQLMDMYDYMKRRYHPGFIVPSVMLLYGIDTRFNKLNTGDRTMLAEMVTYGKAFYFAKYMTPCTPDSVLIGYTTDEIRGSEENESLIWSRLIEDEVLFSTNAMDKQKYILERPKTLEVGERCPGRIGQWVGWRMIKSYQEKHSDASLQDIMKATDASKLFNQSGYKPQLRQLPPRKKA